MVRPFEVDRRADIPTEARFVDRRCDDGGGGRFWYVPGESVPAEAAEVAVLVEEAFDSLTPAVPQLTTSPPADTGTITGFPIYLAVDEVAYAETSGQVSAGGFTVTARLVPSSTVFDPGDDTDPRHCAGAGTRWSSGERPGPDDCTHTYTIAPDDGAYPLVATVRYVASYTVEGPEFAGTYDLGTLDGPPLTTDLPVTERRAVRTTG